MARRTAGSKTSKGKGSKSTTKVSINLDGVSTTSRVPDGDYLVKVKQATVEDTEKGTQYIEFQLSITEGKHEGKTLRHTNSLQPHALFALRNTLEALNYPIPDGAFDLDLKALEGLEMGVAVENEEYNGKDRSRVVDVFSSDDLVEDDEDEDDEDQDFEEAAEDEEEDYEEDSDDEESDEDEDEDEEESDEESDEDEEEYEPYTEEELKDLSDDELIELASEFEVEVSYKGRGAKKRLDKVKIIKEILEAQDEEDEDEE